MIPTSVKNFSELFSGEQLAVYFSLSAVVALLLFYSSMKFLLVFQQCGYRGRRYFTWLSNKNTPYMSRLMLLCLLGFLFFMVLNVCFSPIAGDTVASYIGFVSFILFTCLYINSESSVNAKVPLKKTKRLVRLCITYAILLFAFSFGFITLLNYAAFLIGDEMTALLRLSLVCGTPILTPYLLFVAYLINEPIEEVLRVYHLRVANAKLAASDVIKIGITGSYAKTSVKEILKTLLSQKYRVLATPESYNTPQGIAITAKRLDSTHDVFVAEMGARSKGDIAALAKLVKPKYAVLTGVNSQHLETFGSIECTMDTKFELFENMQEGGEAFFSADNANSVKLFERFNGEKYLAGISGEDNFVSATDINMDTHGMTFTLKIKGEKPIKCSTILLGKHSVKNICLAVAVAYKIGLSVEEIAVGISRLQSIGHRLELLPNNKNIVIIDDSYNSNVDGITAAMDVLDTFSGRKIVLTPGLVELGKVENVVNFEMGKTLAKHADMVVVIGKHNAEMLIKGLLEGGIDRENIKFEKTLNKANKYLNTIIKEGDVVLFENDLPDNYN